MLKGLDTSHFKTYGVWQPKGSGRPRKNKLKCVEITITETNQLIYRFGYSRFPRKVLNQLGKFWVGSDTAKKTYIYIGESQISKMEPELWTVTSSQAITRNEWRTFRKKYLH